MNTAYLNNKFLQEKRNTTQVVYSRYDMIFHVKVKPDTVDNQDDEWDVILTAHVLNPSHVYYSLWGQSCVSCVDLIKETTTYKWWWWISWI